MYSIVTLAVVQNLGVISDCPQIAFVSSIRTHNELNSVLTNHHRLTKLGKGPFLVIHIFDLSVTESNHLISGWVESFAYLPCLVVGDRFGKQSGVTN